MAQMGPMGLMGPMGMSRRNDWAAREPLPKEPFRTRLARGDTYQTGWVENL
jgi:hypothetical protein